MSTVAILCMTVSVFLCHSTFFDGVSARPRYSYRPKDNDALAFFGKQRTNQCSEYGGVCYSYGYCCKNLVCLRQDFLGGRPLTAAFSAAGRCVAEAELDRCETDLDCRSDCSCVEAGRRGRRYCLPKTTTTTPTKTTKAAAPVSAAAAAAAAAAARLRPRPAVVVGSSTTEEDGDEEGAVEEVEEGEGEKQYPVRRPTEKMMMTTTTSDNLNRRWKSFFKTIGGFGSYCETSAECFQMVDQGAGLCCQLVRRGRQIPRRMCDYRTPISFCIQ